MGGGYTDDRRRGRSGRPWERTRRAVFARSDVCGICGLPVDLELDGNHPDGPVADHIDELVYHSDPLDLDNLQTAHRRCNAAKESERRAREARGGRNPSRDW